ncbi:unnamed protein product [Calypogeia fissa]
MAALRDLRRLALACCKLYISDSRNLKALETIEHAARGRSLAPLLHVFNDTDYNRVGYTLAGSLPAQGSYIAAGSQSYPSFPLRTTVTETVRAAIETIDLQEHSGTHPRIGVVDHVTFHALGSASLEEVASLARTVAADIASQFKVPTFLYGAAHSDGRPLDAVRRSLGYFRSNDQGKWVGSPELGISLLPDYGPSKANPRTGVVVVGATPWVMNYNVPIASTDLTIGKMIARKVSQRGGGLPEVQAMALLHGDGCIEIACNLLNVEKTNPTMVQDMVAELAHAQGVVVRPGYLTGHSKEEILEYGLRRLLSTISSREALSPNPYVRSSR